MRREPILIGDDGGTAEGGGGVCIWQLVRD